MADPDRPTARPLSPHLSIYRFTWTMAMSIAHRLTGMACYAASVLVVVWLWAVHDGPQSYGKLASLAGSPFGMLVLGGLSWALIHHAIGGIRHMVWDTGTGLGQPARQRWAQATLGGSLLLTALLWGALLTGAV